MSPRLRARPARREPVETVARVAFAAGLTFGIGAACLVQLIWMLLP